LSQPEVEVVRGDVRDGAAVSRALTGSAAAVNLAGAKSDEPDSESVNVGGAQRIVEAARAHGGVRIIHFSTQAVKIARQGLYARTKAAADRVFELSGQQVTILRPSIVYGPGRSGVFSTMENFIQKLPIVPVLGDGRWVSAPVHVHDVARAVAACLANPATIGRCYDLGGPDSIAFDDLLDRIAIHAGRRCRKLHIPFELALFAARLAVRILPRSPISVSNVLGSNQEIPIDLEPAHRDFAFQPLSLDEGLRLMSVAKEAKWIATEARLFAHYLLSVEADADICRRYATATSALFADAIDGDVAFVRRHPWSLPLVDAATALLRPRSQVRQRVFLMAALLETSPRYAEFFLSPPPRRVRLLFGLARRGLSSSAKLLAGSLLLPFIRQHVARG
jgi:NADH dehydrogenase